MNWPSHRIVPRPARQRRQLAEWLVEREIDLALRDPEAGPDVSVRRAPVQYLQGSGNPRPGDIHILKPAPNGTVLGPVYVLLLEDEREGGLLAVPFSRYATPAVPGECLTGLRAMPLRTLCCWNARPVRAEQLLPGCAKRLSAGKLEELRKKYRNVLCSEPVDDPQARGFGPPLVHPADPRYAYLDEERRRLDLHSDMNESDKRRVSEYGEQNTVQKKWLMAAEGRAGYGPKPQDGK
ncbi:MAG: hypothetical protein AB7T27_07425 [Kiritimatiellia bacterium]